MMFTLLGFGGWEELVRHLLLKKFIGKFLVNLKVVVLSLILKKYMINVVYFHCNKNLFVIF